MTKASLLISLSLITASFNTSQSQRIHYTPDAILEKNHRNLLIPGITGNMIHVWQLHPYRNMVLWQFDTAINMVSSGTVNIQVDHPGQVSFIHFGDFYYMYCSYRETSKIPYELYKVSHSGKYENVTDRLTTLITDTTGVLKRFSILKSGKQFFLMSVLSVPVEHKGIVEIRTADGDLNKKDVTRVSFDLDVNAEQVKQISLINDTTLYVLKANSLKQFSDELTLYQIDLVTKKISSIFYSSNRFHFFRPTIYPGSKGDGLWLIAKTLHETGNKQHPFAQRIFMARLTDSLTEKFPGKLVNVGARTNADAERSRPVNFSPFLMQPSEFNGFILLSAERPSEDDGFLRTSVTFNKTEPGPYFSELGAPETDLNRKILGLQNSRVNINQGYVQGYGDEIRSIRLTWINNELKTHRDTVISNDMPNTNIQFSAGLLWEENEGLKILYPVKIKRRRHGIIRYTVGRNGRISEYLMMTDPSVEHFLNRAIPVGSRTYVFPFQRKNRIGLAKVRY